MLGFDDLNEDEKMALVQEIQDLGSSLSSPIKKGKRPHTSHLLWGVGG